MLKSGWVIVGSTPSNDGTTGTKGAGLPDRARFAGQGRVDHRQAEHQRSVGQHGGRRQRRPRHAVRQQRRLRRRRRRAAMRRCSSRRPCCASTSTSRQGKPPVVKSQTVIGSGFGAQADKGVFLVGPTGLRAGADDTLYVSDAIGNRINAIDDAVTRNTSAGIGRIVTPDGLLHRPLAMVTAPNGHLLVDQRAERPGRRDRSRDRQAALRALDRCRQGANRRPATATCSASR